MINNTLDISPHSSTYGEKHFNKIVKNYSRAKFILGRYFEHDMCVPTCYDHLVKYVEGDLSLENTSTGRTYADRIIDGDNHGDIFHDELITLYEAGKINSDTLEMTQKIFQRLV